MNKVELFHESLRAERWRSLNWRLALFNVAQLPDDHEPRDYDINYIEGIPHYYLDGSWKEVDGCSADEGIYHPNEGFLLEDGMWGTHGEYYTTFGRAVANYTVWNYSVGTRFPYVNKNIMPDDWLDDHIHLVCDDDKIPESGEYITATELGNFIQGVLECKSLAAFITPTGSEITLETHPEMEELKERLFEENKDNLNASTIASIIDQLDEKDKEWLSQDESILYYDSPKARNRRRKLFVIEGVSSAFREDGSFVLQDKPLMGRWEKDDLVAKFNETREGSFQRGAETAKGGEKVTFLQSTFQNHKVVPGNCGASALPVEINKVNVNTYIGLNAVFGKEIKEITPEMAKEHIGKTLNIRRAFLCKQDHIDFCETCASAKFAESPHAIANEEASIGSFIMYGAMSAMHATDLKVAEFIPKYHIM